MYKSKLFKNGGLNHVSIALSEQTGGKNTHME